MTAVVASAPSSSVDDDAAPRALRVLDAAPDLIVSAFAGFALPAMVLLLAGHFSPGWVFPLGLLGAAVAVAVCGIGRRPVDRRAVVYTLIAIGLVTAWVVVNCFYAGENLFAHRDPATYNLAGRWLMDHSSLHIPIQADVFGSPDGGRGAGAGFGSSSLTDLYAQGNHLLPAMLAASGWLFGTGAIFKANVAFGGLALLAFFGLARRVVDVRYALIGMVVFAISMPMIFVSRDTYSEPLALLFLMGGLSLLHRAVESDRIRDFALAGFVVGMAAPARIDSYPGLLAIVVTATILLAVAPPGRRRHTTGRLAALLGAGAIPTLLGWLDITRLASGYYHDERHHIMPALDLGLVLLILMPFVVALFWRPVVRRWFGSPAVSRRLVQLAGVVVATAFVVLLSRPLWLVAHDRYLPSVADMQRKLGQTPDGTRSYDEQTLHWFAMYLGWPTVVLAVTGYFLLIRRLIRTRSLSAMGMITMGLGMSALYVVSAQITPDQPWAMRRFVPVVLPVLIIAATYTLCVLFHRSSRLPRRSGLLLRAGAVALAAVAIAIPAAATAPLATAREEVPQYTQVSRICAQVGQHGAVLDVDAPAVTSYSQTIRSYCNVPSLGLEHATTATLAQVRAAVRAHGRTLYLLSTDVTKIQYANGMTPSAPFSLVRTTRWPSVLHGAPTKVDHEEVAVYLATVRADGLAEPVTPSR